LYKSFDKICMCDIDGSNYQVITTDVYDGPISVGANYIVFEISSVIYTFSFQTNQIVELIEGDNPIISLDGSQILFGDYMGLENHLYKMNIDGSDIVRHKRIGNNCYSFSMSGNRVVYNRLRFVYD